MTQIDIEHQSHSFDRYIDLFSKESDWQFEAAQQEQAKMDHYYEVGDVSKLGESLARYNEYMRRYDNALNMAAKWHAAKNSYYQNAKSYYFTPHKVYKGSKPRGRNY